MCMMELVCFHGNMCSCIHTTTSVWAWHGHAIASWHCLLLFIYISQTSWNARFIYISAISTFTNIDDLKSRTYKRLVITCPSDLLDTTIP